MKKTLIEQAIDYANSDKLGAGYEIKIHFTSGDAIRAKVYPHDKPIRLSKVCTTADGKDEYEEDLFVNNDFVTHVTIEWF